MMEIENLYNLIISSTNEEETFKKNIEVWKKFCDNKKLINRKNLTNKKLYTIIKFLLKNEKGGIFKYFTSNILSKLLEEEKSVVIEIRTFYNNPAEAFNTLLNILENHNEMTEYLTKVELPKDSINKGSVEKYQSYNLKLDTIATLIMKLHYDFFNTEPEIVHKIVAYIEKEVTTIINNETEINDQHLNLINLYIEKIIPIQRYIGKSLNESSMIQQILNGNIQNAKVINELFNTLKEEDILELFDNNIMKFGDFLNKLTELVEVYKQTLTNTICNRLLIEKYFEKLFPVILENPDNIYLKKYFSKEKKLEIINLALDSNPALLSFNAINYLLDENYDNPVFIENLTELIKGSKMILSQEEKNILTEKLKKYPKSEQTEYSLEEATKIIDNYLKQEISISIKQSIDLIRSIIKGIVKNISSEDVTVFFVESYKFNGRYWKKEELGNRIIEINLNLIRKLVNKNESLHDRITVFITLLHEIKHLIQFDEENLLTKEKYNFEKEEKLRKYDPNYYKTNYKIINTEIDARVESYNMLSKLFERFFSDLLDKIQNSIIIDLKRELTIKQQRQTENKINVINKEETDFYLAFDTLIRYNPVILEESPIFLIEYTQKGITKTYDELLLTKTEENKEIVDDIIKRRYPEMMTQELKQKHI